MSEDMFTLFLKICLHHVQKHVNTMFGTCLRFIWRHVYAMFEDFTMQISAERLNEGGVAVILLYSVADEYLQG